MRAERGSRPPENCLRLIEILRRPGLLLVLQSPDSCKMRVIIGCKPSRKVKRDR